jgi:ATP-dependent DNA ligase
MQCKPVLVLPEDESWTFEIKFDGYRWTAVKRGREVRRSTKAFLRSWSRLHRLTVASFSTENLSPLI